ncbi:hypothetical protein VNI00_004970 [Paramarasmius palmivorus]|uniref:Uncharacterized protein n=1 Tax=Paramarasmius palmivorus TaxID=297713 RepID=A0AAW0DIL9_9AGAR
MNNYSTYDFTTDAFGFDSGFGAASFPQTANPSGTNAYDSGAFYDEFAQYDVGEAHTQAGTNYPNSFQNADPYMPAAKPSGMYNQFSSRTHGDAYAGNAHANVHSRDLHTNGIYTTTSHSSASGFGPSSDLYGGNGYSSSHVQHLHNSDSYATTCNDVGRYTTTQDLYGSTPLHQPFQPSVAYSQPPPQPHAQVPNPSRHVIQPDPYNDAVDMYSGVPYNSGYSAPCNVPPVSTSQMHHLAVPPAPVSASPKYPQQPEPKAREQKLARLPAKEAPYNDSARVYSTSPYTSGYKLSYHVSRATSSQKYPLAPPPPPASTPIIPAPLLSQNRYMFVPQIPFPDGKSTFAPITFCHSGTSVPGIKLSTILATKMKPAGISPDLSNAQIAHGRDVALDVMYPSDPSRDYEKLVLTIVWPGYSREKYQRRLSTYSTTSGNLTREALLFFVVREILEYRRWIGKRNVLLEDGYETWNLSRINPEDLVVTGLVHRTGATWQPEIWAPIGGRAS